MCQFVLAQHTTITHLDEVIISDTKLQKFSSSQTILNYNDSIISKNQPLLTDLLQYNSVIYFKQYGRGMLSSVSFRGTTSSQTAVIWNGININSQMNGATDFNTLSTNDYNSISVKGGGGSVLYGSGAIGGSVHLNNNLVFNSKWTNFLKLDYGSFNTQGINFKSSFSDTKWSVQIGVSRNNSTNDYKYPNSFDWRGKQRYNQNGEYSITSLNADLGYKISLHSIIKLYSQSSVTDRNISILSDSEAKTKYVNQFSRNLIEYNTTFNQWTANFKSAFLKEEYRYYPDNKQNKYSFGNTESIIAKGDVSYQFSPSIVINSIVDYTKTKGGGTSFGGHQREISSAALLVKQEVNECWQNELGVRKEFTDNYKSPLLFSLGSAYAFSPLYKLKLNASRNYRIPTYNDLYWEEGGNPNLKPESSYQVELANVIKYKKISFTQISYFTTIKNLLRWIPGDKGIWSPQNTDKVQTYGLEALLAWKTQIRRNALTANVTYAYTISKNVDTGKQLFFVPFHKTTAAVGYGIGKFIANYQFLYNGFVYTHSDNDPKYIVKPYLLSNIGVDYDFSFLDSFKLGFQVLNVWDEHYQSLENLIMPGRNFNMYLTFKF